MQAPLCELDIDYVFTDRERAALADALRPVTLSPYKHYEAFLRQIHAVLESGALPGFFVELCETLGQRDRVQRPVALLRNVPIDADVPVFDPDRPVLSKYAVKTTFTAEAFTATLALLTGVTLIGNLDITGGDVFNDIYPQRSAWQTYSSKGLLSQPFHKDLGNQPVVPDHIHMLTMRSSVENEVYTSFVRSVDIVDDLDSDERELLRQPLYCTAADPATSYDTRGEYPTHAVLGDGYWIRFTEGRTCGTTMESDALARKLDKLSRTHRRRVHLLPGDMVALCNHLALHAREVAAVNDQDALRVRWIIKAASLYDLGPYRHHLVPGTDYLLTDAAG